MFLVSQKMKYAELRLAGWPKCKICNFRGWFIIDLVAAIPFDLLLFGSDTDEVKTSGVKLYKAQTPLWIMFIRESLESLPSSKPTVDNVANQYCGSLY